MPSSSARERVILLHGLGRNPPAMKRLEWALRSDGYETACPAYPSRRYDIATLAERTLGPLLQATSAGKPGITHFVTHSMGGILLRQYLSAHPATTGIGRIVMLAPPNHGSEVVDRLGRWSWYRRVNGPAGSELGTGEESVPCRLGPLPAHLTVGVIAGNRSLNPLFSGWIGAPNDGKVSVASTRIEGMSDHLVLPTSHTWMMWRRFVVDQTRVFLRDGRFDPRGAAIGPLGQIKPKGLPPG
jgi:pimeloyl-ACP methyl ester carboxylesterase